MISNFIDFVLHLDTHLISILQSYGTWCYLLFFIVIFAETGLVVTPFLPGDSLLFALGSLAAAGSLNIGGLFVMLFAAAVLGDNTNYTIGRYFGLFILKRKILKEEHLQKTHKFYEKYGVKTIIIARFVPIVRTFSPFVAGVGTMRYLQFLPYDLAGGALWIGVCLFSGFFFGNIPVVKNNFTFTILAIIAISFLPIVIEIIKAKRQKNNER